MTQPQLPTVEQLIETVRQLNDQYKPSVPLEEWGKRTILDLLALEADETT